MRSLRDRLVAVGFASEETVFHAGDLANNKLNLDGGAVKSADPDLYDEILDQMLVTVAGKQPDTLTYVANGARQYGVDLGSRLELPVIHTAAENTSTGKRFKVAEGIANLHVAAVARRIVVIEDVTTRLGSSLEVMKLPLIDGKVVGLDAVWRRGDPAQEYQLPHGVKADWVVEQPMPNIMSDGDLKFWNMIKELGADIE